MKVGTDAVLLGSWTNIDNANDILDIGTGTAVIALMLAQKSTANIDCIDIDEDACLQAKENILNSKWSSRLQIHNTSLQEYSINCSKTYDIVVSNPPFFVDSSKANEVSRTNARHTDQLSFSDLADGVISLLKPTGAFYVILPTKEGSHFTEVAFAKNLYLTKKTKVVTRKDKPDKRQLMKFELNNAPLQENTIIIEKGGRHDYTDEYMELTKDYYLAF